MPSAPLLRWLVDCTVCGSLAILLVAVLAPILRRWLGARASFWLWALVLLRLFVPGITPSPIPWPAPASAQSPIRWIANAHVPTDSFDLGPVVPESPSKESGGGLNLSPAALPIAVWALGAGVILGFAAIRGLRAGRLARRARDLSTDPTLIALLDELAGSPRRFGVRETAELRSPALCGPLRPVILLPLDWRERMTSAELRFVLRHEIGHFERGDLFWRWAFFLARAVHWFNPLVWIAACLARNHQEMACDEWVVLRLGARAIPAYGEALLAVARRVDRRTPGFPVQADMAESKAGLRRRIVHLATVRRRGWPAGAAAILTGLVGIGLTGTAPSQASRPSVAPAPSSTTFSTEASKPPPEKPTARPGGRVPLQVQIESKFVQVSPEAAVQIFGSSPANGATGVRAIYSREQFQELIRKADQKKGVDLMSAPTVTTKSGQRAVIQIVREFRYPTEFAPPVANPALKIPATPSQFETRNLGVTLEVVPTVTSDQSIQLVVSPEVADFSGFINYGGRREAAPDLARDAIAEAGRQITAADNVINQPVFSVRRMTTSISLKDRQTVLIGVTKANDGPLRADTAGLGAKSPGEPREGSLFIFVTATLIDLEDPPVHRDAAGSSRSEKTLPTPRLDADRRLPYGMPAPDKPGFVISPYAPQNGYVDLRGFPPNAEVKDPYTGKIFLVP